MSQPKNNSILKFNENGKFKIVQFTDIHMVEYHNTERESVIKIITTILQKEKPDLVVLSGDIATSENVEIAWLTVIKPMIDAEIPWTVVFGNHDFEHGYSNEQIMEYLITLPYNYSQHGPKNISGVGNYVLEIMDADMKQTKTLIYCMDSNAYTEEKDNKELGRYDWIKHDQVNWYRELSRKYRTNNKGKIINAVAFFHIPLPEFNDIVEFETTVGEKYENVASPIINLGMYKALLESKDVMGVFVGHDHDNDYIGSLNNICLAYGCKTGIESYGRLDKGARVIELYENERRFHSWLHTLNNSKKYFITYPESFIK